MKQPLINDLKYKLSNNNYYEIETKKTKIVIGNTFSNNMNHFKGWQKRINGNYKKTSHFTVDINGKIYQHFDTKYYSDFTNINNLDKQIISVSIENKGWLLKNTENNQFIDWLGNIYKGNVFEKKWRNFNYWIPYNNKQIKSVLLLLKDICLNNNISLDIIGHNTKIDLFENYSGILYRSNFDKYNTDLNPNWDFEEIKKELIK